MNILPSGPGAVLFELDDLGETEELYTAILDLLGDDAPGARPRFGDSSNAREEPATPRAAVREVVPGARTVLVTAEPGATAIPDLVRRLEDWRPTGRPRARGVTHTVPVHYDGEDLDEVGELTGLGRQGVIEAHTAAEVHVAFCGFSPGFAYLASLPDALRLPRRPTPRTRVPAGSVAIAGEFTGIYPRVSPGGWRLLGHTRVVPWDPGRDRPALLSPGDRVRFVSCPD